MSDILGFEGAKPTADADRLVIKLDPGGPVELNDLTGSFAALARMYERHYRPEGEKETAPKLYVSKLESGSIIAEIVPYTVLLGAVVATMDGSMVISDFCRRISAGIKAFTSPLTPPTTGEDERLPSRADAHDLREFVKPLTGKNGAKLGVKHARFERHEGERHTVAEYTFDETELNRAAINIDNALSEEGGFPEDSLIEAQQLIEADAPFRKNVMLFFEQASRLPGRTKGRTGDRGIIPDVGTKSLPVYFRESFQDLKDRMVRGDVNPLTNFAFVVDVYIQRENGRPKSYVITDVHEVIPLSGK